MGFEEEFQKLKAAVARLEQPNLTVSEATEAYLAGLEAANKGEAELLKLRGDLKLLKNDFTELEPEADE